MDHKIIATLSAIQAELISIRRLAALMDDLKHEAVTLKFAADVEGRVREFDKQTTQVDFTR